MKKWGMETGMKEWGNQEWGMDGMEWWNQNGWGIRMGQWTGMNGMEWKEWKEWNGSGRHYICIVPGYEIAHESRRRAIGVRIGSRRRMMR